MQYENISKNDAELNECCEYLVQRPGFVNVNRKILKYFLDIFYNIREFISFIKIEREINSSTLYLILGEILILEKPFVATLLKQNIRTHCANCFIRTPSLIPCKNCRRVSSFYVNFLSTVKFLYLSNISD